jgi:hypothetical protein
MMEVNVEYSHARRQRVNNILGSYGGVVEETVAACEVSVGMMAGRPGECKC